MRFSFIHAEKATFPIAAMCRVLEVAAVRAIIGERGTLEVTLWSVPGLERTGG